MRKRGARARHKGHAVLTCRAYRGVLSVSGSLTPKTECRRCPAAPPTSVQHPACVQVLHAPRHAQPDGQQLPPRKAGPRGGVYEVIQGAPAWGRRQGGAVWERSREV